MANLNLTQKELQELEALGTLASNLHQMNAAMEKLVEQVEDISDEMRTTERKMGAVHMPFQSSVYELEEKEKALGVVPVTGEMGQMR